KVSHHPYQANDGSGAVLPYPTGGCTTATTGAVVTGGVNGEGTVVTTENLEAQPDTISAYEVGSKNRFLGNQLELNVDEFYYSLGSLALSALSINHVNQQASTAQTQTGVKVWGTELTTTLLITDNDKIMFDASYTTSHAGNSPFADPNCFNFGNPL